MPVVVGALVVGLVLIIATVAVLREGRRLAALSPRPVFDPEVALDWVVRHISDEAAATLTLDDVRAILDFQLQYFHRKGVSGNGSGAGAPGFVVVGGPETVSYILERSAERGLVFSLEQIYAVLETQLAYLRAIGAIGSKADAPGDPDPS